jgi:hypothetical protein
MVGDAVFVLRGMTDTIKLKVDHGTQIILYFKY